MATSWFSCSSRSRSGSRSRKAAAARGRGQGQHVVKLVFPGGHVELLDRPTLAADVMARHPRFCVARPDVFRDPSTPGVVAAPDAVLQLGHKYFVVPCSTVRRLLKYAAASASSSSRTGAGGRGGGGGSGVTLKRHLASERGYSKVGGRRWFRCLVGGASTGSGGGGAPPARSQSRRPPREREGVGHSDSGDESWKAERVTRKLDVKETNKENGKQALAGGVGSPGRRRRRGASASPGHSASYSWQPSLHSITEE